MIVRLAVRVTLPLEEIPRAQLLVAVGACKVFRMPRLTRGRYHLCSKNIIKVRISNHRILNQLSEIMMQLRATWPTIGFSQALQHPFWVVLTP